MTKGERICLAREKKGLSQVALAKKVGISKQNLYKYEKSIITNIPSDKIEAIAHACDVSPEYIMGWDDDTNKFPMPNITDDYTTFPVIGDIAAGYDHIAIESWNGDTVNIPNSYLKGRNSTDFFVLSINGDSMYPAYQDGDKVLILKQTTLEYSGQVGAIIYNDDYATLKKIEYKNNKKWLRLVPINPSYPSITIENEDIEHYHIIGIPRLVIREIND